MMMGPLEIVGRRTFGTDTILGSDGTDSMAQIDSNGCNIPLSREKAGVDSRYSFSMTYKYPRC
jgi:hypothetical protein